MNTTTRVQILGVKRGQVDGKNYATLYTVAPTDGNDKDRLGVLPVSMSCDYDLLDTLKREQVPGEYDLMVNMKPGQGGKVTLHATSCKYIKAAPAGV